jgi:hypothetical protein
MSLRDAEKLAAQRLRVLELEALFQRNELSSTFDRLEKRKALAWGSTLATWGVKLFAQPQVRWLLMSTFLSRLTGRRAR